jgi:penicillin-binding protein 2
MFVLNQIKKGDGAIQKIALLILLAMLLLLGRLWVVQIINARKYKESHMGQSFRTVRIPAVRGRILDRNGDAFAENRASYNVSLYLSDLRKHFEQEYNRLYPMTIVTNAAPAWRFWNRKATVEKRRVRLAKAERDELNLQVRYSVASNIMATVSEHIGEPLTIDSRTFHRHYETRRILPFPLVQNLTPVQIARFEEQPLNTAGLDLEMKPTRVYPYKQGGAHFLGHLTPNSESLDDEEADFDYRLSDFKGEIGIEGAFDEQLHGKAGVKSVQVNRLGYRQHESVWSPAEPGRNVVLTIDRELQLAAEKALQSSTLGVNAKAAAVVMNVQNGDILAMASNPSYDPGSYINGISTQEMLRLNNELLKPQINRPVQGIYPPGSIFKIISGLAELQAGVNPNEIYHSQGAFAMPGRHPIGDTAPAGPYDFKRAFAKSSNSYFIHHGLRIGIRPIIELGNQFFLGQSTDVPVGIKTQRGFFPTMPWISKHGWSDGETANLCIGQGSIAVTPLQMAVMTSAIANGGKIYKPRLVQRTEPQEQLPNGDAVEQFATELRGEVQVRQSNLQVVRAAMLADTEDSEGTAFPAFHESDRRTPRLKLLRVCGKTGTAQVTKGKVVVDHITWFVSYAPYDKPRYAVVIMIESGGSGGGTCAPVAEMIYQAIEKQENPARPKDQVAGL